MGLVESIKADWALSSSIIEFVDFVFGFDGPSTTAVTTKSWHLSPACLSLPMSSGTACAINVTIPTHQRIIDPTLSNVIESSTNIETQLERIVCFTTTEVMYENARI